MGELADCPERTSVMGLAVACALLVVAYACTVFCFCLKRPSSAATSKVILPPEHIPGRSATGISSFGLIAHDYVR